MNAFKFIYGLIHPLGVVARFTLWGGGSGGGGSQQSTNTTYQTNIPEYAKPYVETMLGATQKQLFQGTPTEGGGFDITGFQPYRAYGGTYDAQGNQTSYDPSKSVAGFQPMQQQAQQGIANMQTPEQYGQAIGITGQGIMGGLGTAGQGVGLSGMGYQTANVGNQYAQQATSPYAMQAYMSPYMQNVVDVQQREAQRQADIASTGRNAQAVQAGAFGGSRQAITDAEAARNLATQQGAIQAQGLQNAFQNAQQAQQYGANLGLQGMQAGMQGVGAGIGAQQAGYGQAMSGAQNLAGLGQQQLGAQQGIYSLQNTTGAQQQALEQQKINQAIQDYSNAQQYPLMQLGTMSNMLRGLPMQAQTTQQYVAAPNNVTQAIGAAGAGASLYNAFKGAEGGLPKEFKQSGIMSFSAGGISNDIEHDLYSMDEDDLQRQLKESSSPSVKRMAQRILRMKQMENQQPGMAGGGIIAFGEGELVPPPTSSEVLQQRVMQGKPTGDVMTQPQGIVQTPVPAPKTPLTAQEAVQADPNIPDVLKSQISDIQTRAARSIPDIIKERQAAYEAEGVAQRNPEERANLMKERANADDEAKRNRYLQAAAFFARWGSTPGSTLAAGLTAVRERVPEIIESEKEAKNIRMQIDKSIASLDEATRLEKKGKIDEAAAIKEKDAAKMQDLYLKLSDYEMQAKKEEAKAQRDREHMTSLEHMRKDIADSQNATHLAIADMQTKAERARIAASSAERADQAKWGQLQGIYKSSESAINGINDMRNRKDYTDSKTIIDRAEALRSLNPEGKLPPQFEQSYPKALSKINEIEQEIKDRKDRIQGRVNTFEKRIFGENFDMNSEAPKATPGNRPQVKGAAARGGQPRPEIESFYTR
jgi:hypothetical protein